MDYMKYILQQEGVSLGKSQTFVDIYELLSNQQDIQKVGKKILSTVKLKGPVSLIRYVDSRFYVVETVGSMEVIQKAMDDKSVLKEVLSTKKMYHCKEEVLTKPYYMALPILSKNNEFLGALCIHETQEIKCWKDIHILLHLMAFAYKYYDTIEANKLLTTKDSVTSLFNFRHFQYHLDLEIDKATRHHMPLSLVAIDIKNFKMINEKMTPDGGDEVLRQLGKWIENTSRKVDMPARLEADTFVILLSNTPVEGAHVFLNRLLIKVNNNTMTVNDKTFKIRVKTSVTGFENHLSQQEFIDLAIANLASPEEETE